jgi:hypothetical protein
VHDEVLQLGHTKLRLRHAAGVLTPEQAMVRATRAHLHRAWLVLAAFAVFVMGATGFDSWLTQTPGSTWRPVGLAVLSLIVAVSAWALLWSLMNQVFQRRFPFLQHLRWTLGVVGASWLWDYGLTGLAYALSLPVLQVVASAGNAAAFVALLYLQGRSVWPRAAGRWLLLLGVGVAVAVATTVWQREQQQHWFQPLYLPALPPPAVRFAPLRSPDDLLQDAAALREELARKAALDPVTGDPVDEEE